jgi:endonuclease/exonuclease/phosphatase (EEP) superfamily protein YafD
LLRRNFNAVEVTAFTMMPRFRPRVRDVVAGSLTLAILTPPLVVALADLSRIGHRWTDLLAQFSAPAAVAALAATGLLALLRLRRGVIAGAAVCFLCALAAAPQAFPVTAKPEPSGRMIRLYSANLYVGNAEVAAIRDSVRAARPDVVILIEAGDAPYEALDQIVPDLPHRVASPRRLWRGYGERTIIASRWPLGPLRRERDVRVETPLGPIEVTAVHLTRPWPFQVQWEQIRDVERVTSQSLGAGPTRIVAGDFNAVTDARIGTLFRERSGLTPAPAFPGTWPAALPAPLGIGIDNVWVSDDLAIVERRVGRRNGSDHRPVVTVIGRARR